MLPAFAAGPILCLKWRWRVFCFPNTGLHSCGLQVLFGQQALTAEFSGQWPEGIRALTLLGVAQIQSGWSLLEIMWRTRRRWSSLWRQSLLVHAVLVQVFLHHESTSWRRQYPRLHQFLCFAQDGLEALKFLPRKCRALIMEPKDLGCG